MDIHLVVDLWLVRRILLILILVLILLLLKLAKKKLLELLQLCWVCLLMLELRVWRVLRMRHSRSLMLKVHLLPIIWLQLTIRILVWRRYVTHVLGLLGCNRVQKLANKRFVWKLANWNSIWTGNLHWVIWIWILLESGTIGIGRLRGLSLGKLWSVLGE